MLAMMTVIFMYLHSEMYRISRQSEQKPPLKMYIALIVVTALGALTQYMFLIVAFFTAVFFCVYYLVKRQFKIGAFCFDFSIYYTSSPVGIK